MCLCWVNFLSHCRFQPHRLKHRHNKNSHDLNNHSAKHWDSHGNHDVGAFSGGRQNRQQSNDSNRSGHHRWPDTFHSGGDHCFANIVNGCRVTVFKDLMDVSSHNDSVVGGNSEEGNKSNPNSHTQVNGVHLEHVTQVDSRDCEIQEPILTIQPKHDETSGKSHKYA